MRKYILAAILVLASCSLFAACGVPTTLANASICCVSGLGAPTAYLWVPGLYNAADAAGTDSTGVPVTGACDFTGNSILQADAGCIDAFGAGYYYLYADWSQIPFDGCPAAGATRAALLAYDAAGNYTLQSRLQTEDWTNWDAIGTIAAAPLSAATGTASTPDNVQTTITWTALPASVTLGSYNGAAPAALVTTFNVYTYTGAAIPGYATSQWTLLQAGVSTGTASSTWTFADPGAGVGMWLSRSIVIDGIELPFVSTTPVVLYDPSGAPAINGLSAARSGLNTLVSWTSGDESQVTGYQVFWAPQGGEFSAVGSMINPVGNSNDYTATVRIPATSTFTVKVGAYLTNGSVTYSAPASVKATNIIHDKTRVNID
ncbi:MAG TPA: hypothetical protein PKJ37_10950 [Acidobacteriota bacterium]|nr:hypothetical protein [Acidobacteriota bacterium]HNT18393.1 hypothetical protein [Acidobacteriota bacterium]